MMQSATEILESAQRAAYDLRTIETQEGAATTSATDERLKRMTLERLRARRELDERRVRDGLDLILGCPDLDERESNTLMLRYCNNKKWDDIGEIMGYHRRPCQKFLRSGLDKLEAFVASGGWESQNQ